MSRSAARRARLLAVAALSLAGGCAVRGYTFDWMPDAADGASEAGAPDALRDAVDEATSDALGDASSDAGGGVLGDALEAGDGGPAMDAAVDADAAASPADGAPEVLASDVSDAPTLDPDGASDAGAAASDAASDAVLDAALDAVFDAQPDAVREASVDGALDAPLDVSLEAAPDVGPDVPSPDVADAADVGSADAGCPAGTTMTATGCELPTPAVRRLSPLSGATVGTRRPQLRWVPVGGEALALRLCSDRLCTTTVRREAVAGGVYTVPAALERGVYYWRLEPAASASAVPAEYATTWQFSVTHLSTAVSASSWGALPDYDGDGLADYAVGDPEANGGLGAVYLARGQRGATVSFASLVPVAPPPGAPRGFGTALASGDVNGDGYVDLLIGAPGSGALEAGAAYVRYGGPLARPLEQLRGVGANDGFGASLDASGDANGDGYADVAVGAPRFNEARGVVSLYFGTAAGPMFQGSVRPPPGVTPEPWVPGAGYGAAVAFVGDADGDRLAELLVGAPCAGFGAASPFEARGYFSVYFGSVTVGGGPLALVLAQAPSFPANARLGTAVALGGDINADGLPDAIVGVPGMDLALVLPALGRPDGYDLMRFPVLGNPGANVDLGATIGGGNDLNGDGFDDPVLGAPAANRTGLLFVHIGATTYPLVAQALSELPGVAAGARFGASIALLGDTNGDGLSELLAGAPGQPGGGAVFMQYGRGGIFDGRWEFTRLPAPSAPTARLGAALVR